MAYSLSLNEFEKINTFSNKSMENVVRNVVNNSANAVLVNIFEDSVILLEHTTGDFYMGDYSFDRKSYSLTFSNFEKLDIVEDKSTIKENIGNYFEDDGTIEGIVESYRDSLVKQENYISKLVTEAASYKNWKNNVEYDRVVNKNKDILDEQFIKNISERIGSHPLMEAKVFDWVNSINVSFDDGDCGKVASSDISVKANDLWKVNSFKENLMYSYNESTEDNLQPLVEVYRNFPQLLTLDESEIGAVVGKTLLSTELKKSYKTAIQRMKDCLMNEDVINMKENVISEGTETDSDIIVTEAEVDKIVETLEKIKNDTLIESIDFKINSLINTINEERISGIKLNTLKEAVSIFMLG